MNNSRKFFCYFFMAASLAKLAIADSEEIVTKFLNEVGNQILSIHQLSISDNDKNNQMTAVFEKVVDYSWMGKFVLGASWNTLNDSKKTQYLTSYHHYLLKTYLPKFKKYHATSYRIKSVQEAGNNQFIAQVVILQTPPDPELNLSYRLECSNGCKFRDVVAEGISMLSSQRSDFNSIVSTQGVDQLINLMQSK